VGGENVQSVNDTRNITQDCEEDVDQEICSATSLEENTNWWENDSKNDLADITVKRMLVSRTHAKTNRYINIRCGERHFEAIWMC
jgi:predicted DNA binding CopG/RHH family protein